MTDYRETAAKFQKEWHVKQPHQHFSFAPHVKGHALVSVINRGLIYHSLERQQAGDEVSKLVSETTFSNLSSSRTQRPRRCRSAFLDHWSRSHLPRWRKSGSRTQQQPLPP